MRPKGFRVQDAEELGNPLDDRRIAIQFAILGLVFRELIVEYARIAFHRNAVVFPNGYEQTIVRTIFFPRLQLEHIFALAHVDVHARFGDPERV